MTCLPKHQPARFTAELRDHGVVFPGKGGFCKNTVKIRKSLRSRCDVIPMLTQRISNLQQNAVDFAQLILPEADKLIVESNGFERLYEQSSPGSAGTVDDSVHASFMPGNDGDHISVLANGDKVFLQSAIGAMSPKEAVK